MRPVLKNAWFDQIGHLNSYRQCQRKTHKISLKESDKIPESTHNITETYKESLKPLTETDKEPTNYKGPWCTMSGLKKLGGKTGVSLIEIIKDHSRRGICDARCALRTLNPTKHLRACGQERPQGEAEPASWRQCESSATRMSPAQELFVGQEPKFPNSHLTMRFANSFAPKK